jgi:hypothetical protein
MGIRDEDRHFQSDLALLSLYLLVVFMAMGFVQAVFWLLRALFQ